MRVLVNGVGNIGTTLLQVLAAHRRPLGIDEVLAHRTMMRPWDAPQVARLQGLGVTVLATGMPGFSTFEDRAADLDYVFDTSRQGVGRANKERYAALPRMSGASAQGSEKGFGEPYMVGLPGLPEPRRFATVVSCNTHAALAVLATLSGGDLSTVVSADFVVARRSEDVSGHERLVSGNVVARHLDPDLGTHHAIDAHDVLETVGCRAVIHSSDITTPSQFLHATRFSVRLEEPLTVEAARERIRASRFCAATQIFDSNKVFEIGRRFGLAGRLYAQAIFVENNLQSRDGVIAGWAFAPQEGNTILSTLGAFLACTKAPADASAALAEVADSLLLRAL